MLVSWQKGMLPSNFPQNVTFGVISTAESLYNKPQTTGGEKDFMDLSLAKYGVFGLTRWSKLLLS